MRMRKCYNCKKWIPFHKFRKCKCDICQTLCRDCTDIFIGETLKDVKGHFSPFKPLGV